MLSAQRPICEICRHTTASLVCEEVGCGKKLCVACGRIRGGKDICKNHGAAASTPPPPVRAPRRARGDGGDEADRSPEYLAFVRTWPCAVCPRRDAVVAHHHGKANAGGGIGRKGSDYQTVPLCQQHHGEYHASGAVLAVEGNGAGSTEILFYRAMAKCMDFWLQGKVAP